LNTKTGYVFNNHKNQSFGLQTIFRIHKQKTQFGVKKYDGHQNRMYFSLIGGSDLWNKNHTVKGGFSFNADRFENNYFGNIFNYATGSTFSYITPNGLYVDSLVYDRRLDLVSGLFLEYNFKNAENFNLNIGLRSDYYNKTDKIYYSPRFNFKYNPSDKTVVRFSAGKGFRIPNVLTDHIYYMASSSMILIDTDISPEEAWNYGANFAYCFYLFSREGTFNVDFYKTIFHNKVYADRSYSGALPEVSFSNIYDFETNTIQVDLSYELIDRLNVKSSIKYTDSSPELHELTPKNRSMINIAYSNKNDRWKFDYTINRIGVIPLGSLPVVNLFNDRQVTNPFYVHNMQITHIVKGFDIYMGVENIFNYVQENPIINAQYPFSDNFDASLIYGPVMGRLIYAGLRYKL
jgi:outer membrane receptor for ferrienterochelin and colicin